MMLLEHEDRLVAANDEANAAVVWSAERKVWNPTAPIFARKAWAEGEPLSADEARARYPDADLEAIPALEA